ncbi:MAG: CopG family transcriptional regulator [Acidobacteria bacterium]|nr:CopG family transcriptional regulator [Acidobacteriota bacterium]
MKTVQMTLDEELVRSVDRAAKKMHTTRSAFTRDALREALRKVHIERLEQQHRKGYERNPIIGTEFGVWEEEQAWGDE